MSKRLILLFLFFPLLGVAQLPVPKIEIGPERISMNEELRITVTIYGPSYELDDFPEIGGFERGSRTIKHSEIRVDGKSVETHIITKNYKPIEGGEFTIQPFEIEINQKIIKTEAKKIIVEDDEEGYDELSINVEAAEFITECSKKEIFVGEGVKVRLSFYMSSKNTVNWQFSDDISSQVEAMAKQIKPENCLESRNVISSISQREEYIKGVKYFVYDVFEAVYYPLNKTNIIIPSLSLKMKKGEGQTGILRSKPQTVLVKDLPPHALKDKVPVGNFRIKDHIQGSSDKVTGESFDFQLTVEGQGNMDAINFGKIISDKNFDFFESGVRLNQEGGKLAGSRTFNYKVLPKVAGEYDLGNNFSIVYFDIKTARYDTISAKSTIRVTGNTIVSKDNIKQDIYSGIENLRTDKNDFSIRKFLKLFANFILVFMVMFLIFIWKKK